MSGIYIPGMEMPKEDRALCIIIHHDGKVCHFFDLQGEQIATAVPVPEHGDLIDRKTAYESILNGMVMTGYQSRALDCVSEFYAPTIIHADPAKEGDK